MFYDDNFGGPPRSYIRFCVLCGSREEFQHVAQGNCRSQGRGPCTFPAIEPFAAYSLSHDIPLEPTGAQDLHYVDDSMPMTDTSPLQTLPYYEDLNYYQLFAFYDQSYNRDPKHFQSLQARAFLLPIQCITYGLVNGPLRFQSLHRKILDGNVGHLPFGLNSIVERLMAQLFINGAKSVIGIPAEHDMGGRIHRHHEKSWWCRLATSPLPQLPLRDVPAPLAPSSTRPFVHCIRLYSAQGNFYEVEIQACNRSTMIRHFIRRHGVSSLPLPTIGADTLEQIICYLRYYTTRVPPEIDLPVIDEYL